MKLGFLTAPFPETPLMDVADWAAGASFEVLEIACWPRSTGPSRRYAGTSHIDVANLSAAQATEIRDEIGAVRKPSFVRRRFHVAAGASADLRGRRPRGIHVAGPPPTHWREVEALFRDGLGDRERVEPIPERGIRRPATGRAARDVGIDLARTGPGTCPGSPSTRPPGQPRRADRRGV